MDDESVLRRRLLSCRMLFVSLSPDSIYELGDEVVNDILRE